MYIRWLFAISCVWALAACGGGGGSDNNIIGPIQGLDRVPITADTAEETAATVVRSIDGAFSAGESALGFGGAVGARVEGDPQAAVDVALEMAERARGSVVSLASGAAVGAVITETQDCTGGGSVSVSIDTGSLSEEEFAAALQEGSIPAGTTVTTEFTSCVEPESGTLNGTVRLVIQQLAISGEIGVDAFTIEFDAEFVNFQTDEGTIHGDISLLLTSNAGATDATISGDSLEVSASGEALALVSYRVTAMEDNSEVVETFDFTLQVSVLGELDVETLESWRTLAFAENPISGVLRIVGDKDGSITVTALDETSVELKVDADGDGVVDATIVTTWAELRS